MCVYRPKFSFAIGWWVRQEKVRVEVWLERQLRIEMHPTGAVGILGKLVPMEPKKKVDWLVGSMSSSYKSGRCIDRPFFLQPCVGVADVYKYSPTGSFAVTVFFSFFLVCLGNSFWKQGKTTPDLSSRLSDISSLLVVAEECE